MILEDLPILPVYTYVTKRLVDPHVKGWQNKPYCRWFPGKGWWSCR